MLFEYHLGYSRVIPYKMNSRLRYTSYLNPVYIECTTVPSHSFKENCLNCFVCFSTHNMTSFKLVIVEGIDYNIVMSPGCIVDGVLRVRECNDDLFRNVSMTCSIVVFCVVRLAGITSWFVMVRDIKKSIYIGFSTLCVATHVKISAQRSPLRYTAQYIQRYTPHLALHKHEVSIILHRHPACQQEHQKL
jgi:hypothetical protein